MAFTFGKCSDAINYKAVPKTSGTVFLADIGSSAFASSKKVILSVDFWFVDKSGIFRVFGKLKSSDAEKSETPSQDFSQLFNPTGMKIYSFSIFSRSAPLFLPPLLVFTLFVCITSQYISPSTLNSFQNNFCQCPTQPIPQRFPRPLWSREQTLFFSNSCF